MAQLGLKPDDVVKGAKFVGLAQVDHRRVCRDNAIGQPDRFEAVAQVSGRAKPSPTGMQPSK